MSKKKKIDNVYVIRKMVRADSIAEALKKEKRSPVLEVTLVKSDGKELRAAIGFNYSTIDEDDNGTL